MNVYEDFDKIFVIFKHCVRRVMN